MPAAQQRQFTLTVSSSMLSVHQTSNGHVMFDWHQCVVAVTVHVSAGQLAEFPSDA